MQAPIFQVFIATATAFMEQFEHNLYSMNAHAEVSSQALQHECLTNLQQE